MSVSASINRIKANSFTEADVNALILHEREHTHIAAIRDLGHLVAHPDRDKGIINSAAIDHYCVTAFMTKYNMRNPEHFSYSGECDWFLKRFLKSQIIRFDAKTLKKSLGTSQKSILREINSYFLQGDEFPIHFGNNPAKYTVIASERFEKILSLCASKIMVKPAADFTEQKLAKAVEKVCTSHKINLNRMDDIIVCIAILLHGKKHFLDDIIIGKTEICLGKNIDVFLSSNPPKTKDWDIALSIPIFQTTINAADYFREPLLKKIETQEISLSSLQLGFDSRDEVKVTITPDLAIAS